MGGPVSPAVDEQRGLGLALGNRYVYISILCVQSKYFEFKYDSLMESIDQGGGDRQKWT